MKKLIVILLIVILVILVGTWPLTAIAKLFEWVSYGLLWLAKALDFFHLNGMM